jgi:hypothetical protein
MSQLAISLGVGDVILIVVFVTIPIALLTFIFGAGRALKQVGKGPLAVQFESDLPQKLTDSGEAGSPEGREEEIRQLLEAKAYRQRSRGETPVDVDSEYGRLMREGVPGVPPGADPRLAEEVRQLVVARNERRARQGKEPLDVEREVERQLRDLEGLGQ